MQRCGNCGEENPERARFCLSCGTPLAGAPQAEVRKTVSILFADVVSSTSRAEQTDPESTRRMLARYFDAMRRVVERHGGTVEKFIGDAVMAVFGIPTLHEDDALRAVRAATEMRAATAELNREVADAGWAPISLRIGVNTGEVVTGDPSVSQTLVTGDAVNVTARLEQAAAPDEVILGAATYRLVREAVEAEPMPPLELKGKKAPVEAFRLVALAEREIGRRHDTPLVGRRRELRLLGQAVEAAVDERTCYLFTLLGPAGVGKSRLVHEFLAPRSDATRILRARCLPYGEGITFWPIRELVQEAAGIGSSDAQPQAIGRLGDLLEGDPESDAIVERLAATIGLSSNVVPTVESFWAVRKLLEWLARDRPLIVVIDDLHWAEPTLLDLVDHIADWSREAPILLLAIARPELLDERPQWGGGKLNATTILLEPLGAEDSAELIGNLVHDPELGRAVLARIGETAEGNPLFVEELVAMLVDDGVLRRVDGNWETGAELAQVRVPPTISALVAARLDHLEPSERELIGRASVVGKVFQRSAVTELSPPERRDNVGARLMALVRKELVRPDRSTEVGDEAFRFRHILVRDAAYRALPKEQRADLHARFADWLERSAGERLLEMEELIAYHLEQAHGYRLELGLADEITRALRDRAQARLAGAGRRAMSRQDFPAVESLLARALRLTDDDRERLELIFALGQSAFHRGARDELTARFAEAREAAARIGDELARLRVEVKWLDGQLLFDPEADEGQVETVSRRLEQLAVERGDRTAQAEALLARASVFLNRCQWQAVAETLEEAASLVPQGVEPGMRMALSAQYCNALRYGPMPAAEAIRAIEAWSSDRGRPGTLLVFTAPLLAMGGDFGEAHRRADEDLSFMRERGLRLRIGSHPLVTAPIWTLEGDLERAHAVLAEGIEILQSIGETGVLSTLAAMDANALYHLGRREEVLSALDLARRTGSRDDIATQAHLRATAALVSADDGRSEEAERLIDEALAMVEATDFLELRALVRESQAGVAARAGHPEAWRAAMEAALAEHERKGNLVAATHVRGELAAGPPAAAEPAPSA